MHLHASVIGSSRSGRSTIVIFIAPDSKMSECKEMLAANWLRFSLRHADTHKSCKYMLMFLSGDSLQLILSQHCVLIRSASTPLYISLMGSNRREWRDDSFVDAMCVVKIYVARIAIDSRFSMLRRLRRDLPALFNSCRLLSGSEVGIHHRALFSLCCTGGDLFHLNITCVALLPDCETSKSQFGCGGSIIFLN